MSVSKAAVREYLKRVRENVHDIEKLLKTTGPLDAADLEWIVEWGLDISGAGAAIAELAETE